MNDTIYFFTLLLMGNAIKKEPEKLTRNSVGKIVRESVGKIADESFVKRVIDELQEMGIAVS